MDAVRDSMARVACRAMRAGRAERGQGTTEYAILVGV